nr:MAG TPA: hypothetical protein [Caudoviricetes sp.]DAS04202.1 MAG TPA: hypothetical protein [Caudoviricetes sp.]
MPRTNSYNKAGYFLKFIPSIQEVTAVKKMVSCTCLGLQQGLLSRQNNKLFLADTDRRKNRT